MSRRRTALLALLVIGGTVAVGLPATAQETATETAAAQSGSAGGMGTQLTAFLQANSAAANNTVENGMWKAAYNRSNETTRPERMAERAGSLERRLERLKQRNATLERRYANGSLSEQAYVAQRSRLTAEIAGLQTAIADADAAAERDGMNDTALERLKSDASEFSGQYVASVASGIVGPPDDAGPPTGARNRSDRGPPEAAGPTQSEPGPPDDTSARGGQGQPDETGNESDGGPPDDTGNGDAPQNDDSGSDATDSDGESDAADDAEEGDNGDGGAEQGNGAENGNG